MTARQTGPAGDVDPPRVEVPPATGAVGAGGSARDIVDEVGEDSFPSSDPPSWSRAVAS
jgi:hypothetical protein